jgi:aminoacrylate hydrolase
MHYETHGPAGAPAVVLSSGLGGAAHYWAPNIPALARDFHVIAYDQFGTGRSPGALPDGYTIAQMADELAAMLDSLGVSRCHFIGHALGGLIGLQLALGRPALLDRLVVVNAWAKTHPHTLRCFAARKSLLLNTGTAAYVAAQPLFLYPPNWMAARTDWLTEQDKAGVAHFPPVEAVLRRIGAVEAFDISARLAEITVPTLAIATRDDMLVPSLCSVTLADGLADARLELLETGGHACNVTDPNAFDLLAGTFLRAN